MSIGEQQLGQGQAHGAIGYINPGAPPVAEPQYQGERYAAVVPATYDVAERCRLAVNALTETLDPEYDYELYWIVDLLAEPPAMFHTTDDHVEQKFFQSLPLCRTASGSTQNLQAEHALMHRYLKMQGDDGLIYIPIRGRPWALPEGAVLWAGMEERPTGDHWASFIMMGRVLGAFSIYALKDPDGPWADAARRLVQGMRAHALDDGDGAYFFSGTTEPGRPVVERAEPPQGFIAAIHGWAAQGLAQCHRALGDEDARDLALRFARFVMRDSGYFGPNGEFQEEWPDRPEMGQHQVHFHAHTMQILAALEVVQATGDEELLDVALKAYNYALTQGDAMLGYFPEWLTFKGGMYGLGPCSSELCEVADMVACAVKLSLLGIDRWDDVDRWVRNMFAEGQLTDVGWLTDGHREAVDRHQHPLPVADWDLEKGGTTERVAERVLGSFSGWPAANDFVHGNNWSIMHCCTGNGTRSLYYVWEAMLRWVDGRLRLNLLMNRASAWADVDSHIPYTGRVDVHVKQDLDLEVRLPEWVQPGQMAATVNGEERPLPTDGRYGTLTGLGAGDEVVLTFAMPETTHHIVVEKHPYTIVRRGNDVVSIDPPGQNRPLYQRGHYRTGETLWHEVERFVPQQEIPWA